MPKADKSAVDKRRANYKKNAYTQAWAEGRFVKSKGKGKGKADGDNDGENEEEVKVGYRSGRHRYLILELKTVSNLA